MKQKGGSEPSHCVDRLKVLANTTRLAVVEILMSGQMYVGELNEVLGLDQSLLSHHLAVLREAGLVEATRDGKAVLYRLAPSVAAARSGKAIDLGCCRISFN